MCWGRCPTHSLVCLTPCFFFPNESSRRPRCCLLLLPDTPNPVSLDLIDSAPSSHPASDPRETNLKGFKEIYLPYEKVAWAILHGKVSPDWYLVAGRCRATLEQIRQSRPDSGLNLSHFQCESLYVVLMCSSRLCRETCARPYTPTPFTLHPTPCTLHPSPDALHPTPCTPHPTPYTPHPTSYTLSRSLRQRECSALTTYWSGSTSSSK